MRCRNCAATLPADSLFCGECGRAVSVTSAASAPSGLPPLNSPVPSPAPWMNASASTVCEQCGSAVTPDDIFCGECGFLVNSSAPPPPEPLDTNVVERLQQGDDPEILPASAAAEPDDFVEDLESTRIVQPRPTGERFVLQFSTGESFTVHGSGLIGRNPRPEPSEFFDHLVRITDAGRSVSKTHLEFGHEGGAFWVKDRFSGNGTVIREPDSDPERCHPDRRYRLVRGSRVDLGEQFFIVS